MTMKNQKPKKKKKQQQEFTFRLQRLSTVPVVALLALSSGTAVGLLTEVHDTEGYICEGITEPFLIQFVTLLPLEWGNFMVLNWY